MSPTAPLKPCPVPLCSALVASGRCPEHQRPAFARRRAPSKRPMGSGWAWDRKKQQVLERDGYRCYLCGNRAITVDHVVNRARGGTDSDANLGAICAVCHRRKTAREAAQGRAEGVGRSELGVPRHGTVRAVARVSARNSRRG